MKLKTPYAHLLPPLSAEEYAALEASIAELGQQTPVLIDEEGNIIDGHNRHRILGDKVTTKVVSGKTDLEKKAMIYRFAGEGRQMTAEHRRELTDHMKATARGLRAEDPKKNTQTRIASMFGVARKTVRKWLTDDSVNVHNAVDPEPAHAPKPDGRVKYTPAVKAAAVRRVVEGEKQAAVVADLGMPVTTLSGIVSKAHQSASTASSPEQPKAKPVRPKDPSLVAFDAEVCKLYRYMCRGEIAESLGTTESKVSVSIVRQGLSGSKGPGRKADGLEPLRRSLAGMVEQLDYWQGNNAAHERRYGSPGQYRTALEQVEQVVRSARNLKRILTEEVSI